MTHYYLAYPDPIKENLIIITPVPSLEAGINSLDDVGYADCVYEYSGESQYLYQWKEDPNDVDIYVKHRLHVSSTVGYWSHREIIEHQGIPMEY